ncbi:MAG: hypothetical protein ACLPUO_23265 [Streptosporangiaceae bacterium]|jgi:hypothetical protein
MVFQLRGVNDHYVIRPGDLGYAAVQIPGRQSHHPERERRLRR